MHKGLSAAALLPNTWSKLTFASRLKNSAAMNVKYSATLMPVQLPYTSQTSVQSFSFVPGESNGWRAQAHWGGIWVAMPLLWNTLHTASRNWHTGKLSHTVVVHEDAVEWLGGVLWDLSGVKCWPTTACGIIGC